MSDGSPQAEEAPYQRSIHASSSDQASSRREHSYASEPSATMRENSHRGAVGFYPYPEPIGSYRSSYESQVPTSQSGSAFVPYESRYSAPSHRGAHTAMSASVSLPSLAHNANAYPAGYVAYPGPSSTSSHGHHSLSRTSSSSHVGKGTRARVTMACVHCRSRKIRCDGRQPTCSTCSRLGRTCNYENISEEDNAVVREKKKRNREAKQLRLDALSKLGVPPSRRSGAPGPIAMPSQSRIYPSGPFTAPAYPTIGGVPSTFAFHDTSAPTSVPDQSALQRGAGLYPSDYLSATGSLPPTQGSNWNQPPLQPVPSSSWQTMYGGQYLSARPSNPETSQMYSDLQPPPLPNLSSAQPSVYNQGIRRRGATMNDQDLHSMRGSSRLGGHRGISGSSGGSGEWTSGSEWTSGAPHQHFDLPASGRHDAGAGDDEMYRGNPFPPSVLTPAVTSLSQPSTPKAAYNYHAHLLAQEFAAVNTRSSTGSYHSEAAADLAHEISRASLVGEASTHSLAVASSASAVQLEYHTNASSTGTDGNDAVKWEMSANTAQSTEPTAQSQLPSFGQREARKSSASSDQLRVWQQQQQWHRRNSPTTLLAMRTPPPRPMSAVSSASSTMPSSVASSMYSSPAVSQQQPAVRPIRPLETLITSSMTAGHVRKQDPAQQADRAGSMAEVSTPSTALHDGDETVSGHVTGVDGSDSALEDFTMLPIGEGSLAFGGQEYGQQELLFDESISLRQDWN